MAKKLSPYLLETLHLVAKGYKHEAIARELGVKTSTIDTYVKRLKERFEDEPEMSDPNLSSESALLLMARRYLNTYEQEPLAVGPRMDTVSSSQEEETTDALSQELQTLVPSSDLIDFLADYSRRIYKVSLDGSPQVSIQMANEFNHYLIERERGISSPNSLKPLLKIRAQTLFDQGRSYTQISFPHEVFSLTKPIVNQLREIANKCENGEIYGLADHLLGSTYYHIGKRNLSVHSYIRALTTITDDPIRLEALRASCIDLAYLKDRSGFSRLEKQTKEVIIKLSESDRLADLECACMALEGLGRAQALLKSPQAFDTLQWGKDVYKKMEQEKKGLPLRAIQLIRSELVAIQNLEPTNKVMLEKVGNEGISLARKFQYQRYESAIQELLEKSL